ncbi:methyl-accepting chemotaxis protein, partial [Methylorubrum salsuginis]
SEELAAQAETLQATIAYFRIDGAQTPADRSREIDGAVTQLRSTAARMAASPVVKSPVSRSPAKRAAIRPAAKAAGGGFAFDMGEGDDRDADFTRVA